MSWLVGKGNEQQQKKWETNLSRKTELSFDLKHFVGFVWCLLFCFGETDRKKNNDTSGHVLWALYTIYQIVEIMTFTMIFKKFYLESDESVFVI